MNKYRRIILSQIGNIIYRIQRTWAYSHFMSGLSFINVVIIRKSFKKASEVYIKLPIEIDGGEYISIGEYTHFDRDCVISAFNKTYDGSEFSPSINIGKSCNFGAWNHITAVNAITIGDGFLSGKWVTICDNNHGGG